MFDKLKGLLGGNKSKEEAPASVAIRTPEPETVRETAPPPEPGPEVEAVDLAAMQAEYDENKSNVELGFKLAQAYEDAGQDYPATYLLQQLAQILEDMDPPRAVQALQKVKTLGKADAETHFTMARIYRSMGKLPEAEQEVRGVLRLDFNNTQAMGLLCDLAVERGNYKHALLICNKLLGLNPRDPLAREKLADVQAAQNETAEAIKTYLMAAYEFKSSQARDDARRLYEKVLELDPSNPTATREIGNLA